MASYRSKNRRKSNSRRSSKQKRIPSRGSYRSDSTSVRRRIGKVLDIRYKILRLPVLRFILLIFLFSIVIFSTIWVIKTGYFQVTEIVVEGTYHVTEEQVLNVVEEIRTKNVFMISPRKYEEKLVEADNYIRSAYVEKTLPNKITVHIEEYEPTVVWRTINGAYLIDNDGYILERSLTENTFLDSVIQSVLVLNDDMVEDVEGSIDISEEEEGGVDPRVKPEDDKEEDEEIVEESVILDPELEKQIDLEIMKEENEIDLAVLDFDTYNVLPDSFKKYPQIKRWSDEVLEVNEYIDEELLGNYLLLIQKLPNYSSFRMKEALIFSQKKVLVIFENEVRIFFDLSEDIADQINTLEFIWGRLQVEGVEFREIDLRFKRPVIRQ